MTRGGINSSHNNVNKSALDLLSADPSVIEAGDSDLIHHVAQRHSFVRREKGKLIVLLLNNTKIECALTRVTDHVTLGQRGAEKKHTLSFIDSTHQQVGNEYSILGYFSLKLSCIIVFRIARLHMSQKQI